MVLVSLYQGFVNLLGIKFEDAVGVETRFRTGKYSKGGPGGSAVLCETLASYSISRITRKPSMVRLRHLHHESKGPRADSAAVVSLGRQIKSASSLHVAMTLYNEKFLKLSYRRSLATPPSLWRLQDSRSSRTVRLVTGYERLTVRF